MLAKFTALTTALGLVLSTVAQIAHEGAPFGWGTPLNPVVEYVTTAPLDWAALQAADAVTDQYKEAPWRFGVECDVHHTLDNSGTWTEEDGERIWRLGIRCPEGMNISFRLDTFNLGKNSALYVYNADRTEYLGAFTEANEKDWGGLAIGLIDGDEAVLELREPAGDEGMNTLVLGQIIHGYRSLLAHAEEVYADMAAMGPFGTSGACNINVNCPEGADWQTEKKSVALITSGGFASCTGALVNNVMEDGTPYFLTANHCLGTPASWVFYFNHESSTCSGSTGPTNQSISGATLLANNSGSDVALVELSATPPVSYDVHYAGWDATGASPANATGIHHPSGDVKKICFQENAPTASTASGAQVWWIDDWELGVTEPGSSGSPLFDQNHRIIGQLYGGAAACSGTTNNGQYDYYGQFHVSWDAGSSASTRLKDWLDPNNTGTLILDGYPSADPTVGCTDETACNYSSTALTDDGSCLFNDVCGNCGGDGSACTGCTDETACNFDPSAYVDDGSCFSGGGSYTLTLLTDNYPGETTWEVADENGDVWVEGNGYSGSQTTYTETFCLAPGCYTFTIFDSYGDGLQYNGVVGDYTLEDANGNAVAEMVAGGNFGFSAAHDFCQEDEVVSGCTDPSACNFNAAANEDDGSCISQALVYLDGDGDGFGAGPALSSCSFTGDQYVATNGDCDDTASHVHPGAPGTGEDVDNDCNGTIEGDEVAVTACPGDLNNDGTVAMSDFLVFLGDFGCITACIGDLNGDGNTSTADMLVLLGLFGTSCF